MAVEVRPVTRRIGAEVQGVDLREPLDEATVALLRRALLDHLVLFFRDQPLNPGQQLAFAARFGPTRLPMGGPPVTDGGLDQYFDVLVDDADSPPKADFWHTDVAFLREPPDIAVLAMEASPPVGGDTSWLDLYGLYDSLSPGLRDFVDGLDWELHLGRPFRTAVTAIQGAHAYRRMAGEVPVMRHPMVRVHPETGRRALFWCGPFIERVADLHPDESAALIDLLRRRLDDPNLQVRWRWHTHDLAVWDERCTNHRANSDHAPSYRRIRRCVVGAAVPEGPRHRGGRVVGAWTGEY